jgi:RNA polymerase sigma-70 factor, ECF subfamily
MSDELAQAIARARAAWPHVVLGEAQFLDYLDERLPDREHLNDLSVEDLYLACGCAHGNLEALRAFESCLTGDVETVLIHMKVENDLRQDVLQLVRTKVIMGQDGTRPKIADYLGSGPLRNWLRAVVTRTALDVLRARPRRAVTDSELLRTVPAAIDDPETAFLRQRYASEFSDCFREAFAELSVRDRVLLKRHFVDGLSTEQIGELHRVHRVTVLRWITRALKKLAQRSQKLLSKRLDLGSSEYESIVRLVRSQLDLSLSTLLQTT